MRSASLITLVFKTACDAILSAANTDRRRGVRCIDPSGRCQRQPPQRAVFGMEYRRCAFTGFGLCDGVFVCAPTSRKLSVADAHTVHLATARAARTARIDFSDLRVHAP